MNRLNRDRHAQADADQKALQKIDRAIAGIMAAIEDGLYQPSMKARMNELERDKAEIFARMAQSPADIPDVHPNITDIYRRNVKRFTEALNDPDGGREAVEALRSLIGEIVLTPARNVARFMLSYAENSWASSPSPPTRKPIRPSVLCRQYHLLGYRNRIHVLTRQMASKAFAAVPELFCRPGDEAVRIPVAASRCFHGWALSFGAPIPE